MTNKLQQELREAIIDWRNASAIAAAFKLMDGVESYDKRANSAWQKLESLISQCVPMKSLELACEHLRIYINPSLSEANPIYWQQLAEAEKETE